MLAEWSSSGSIPQPGVLEAIPRAFRRKATSRMRHRRSQGRVVAGRRISEVRARAAGHATDAVLPAAGATSTTEVTIRGTLLRADRARGGKIATRWDESGPPSPSRNAPRSVRRNHAGIRPARDDARPAAATVQETSRRHVFRHCASRRGHDRRDLSSHARPRRADAPSDAGGARSGRREARRVRHRSLVGRAWLAHPHVQPHDAASFGVAGGGREYQRTLEERSRRRSTSSNSRRRTRTSSAARHSQGLPTGRPQPAVEADHRTVAPHATHVACLFLDFDHFKGSRHARPRLGDQFLRGPRAYHRRPRIRYVARPAATSCGDLPGRTAHATFETMTVLARIRESSGAFRLADQTPTCVLDRRFDVPIDPANRHADQAADTRCTRPRSGRNAYRLHAA